MNKAEEKHGGRPAAKPRFNKDGTPRKQAAPFAKTKPAVDCLHEWHLTDLSNVPTCAICKGQTVHGEWLHASALVQAGMRSTRGTRTIRSESRWRDVND